MSHKAVRVSQNIVVAPWAGAFSSMITLTFWEARPGILKETSSDTLCSAQEVDKGKYRNRQGSALCVQGPQTL